MSCDRRKNAEAQGFVMRIFFGDDGWGLESVTMIDELETWFMIDEHESESVAIIDELRAWFVLWEHESKSVTVIEELEAGFVFGEHELDFIISKNDSSFWVLEEHDRDIITSECDIFFWMLREFEIVEIMLSSDLLWILRVRDVMMHSF